MTPLEAEAPFKTIREMFWDSLRAGNHATCPCCDRYAQIYKRRLNAGIAVHLIKLLKSGGEREYIHFRHFATLGSGRDFTTAKHWGLIEAKTQDITERLTPSSGYWRLTPLGAAFVRKEASVPEWITTYNDNLLERGSSTITISEALGRHFNYSELMEGHISELPHVEC